MDEDFLYKLSMQEEPLEFQQIQIIDKMMAEVSLQDITQERSYHLTQLWQMLSTKKQFWDNMSELYNNGESPLTKTEVLRQMAVRIQQRWPYLQQSLKEQLKKFAVKEIDHILQNPEQKQYANAKLHSINRILLGIFKKQPTLLKHTLQNLCQIIQPQKETYVCSAVVAEHFNYMNLLQLVFQEIFNDPNTMTTAQQQEYQALLQDTSRPFLIVFQRFLLLEPTVSNMHMLGRFLDLMQSIIQSMPPYFLFLSTFLNGVTQLLETPFKDKAMNLFQIVYKHSNHSSLIPYKDKITFSLIKVIEQLCILLPSLDCNNRCQFLCILEGIMAQQFTKDSVNSRFFNVVVQALCGGAFKASDVHLRMSIMVIFSKLVDLYSLCQAKQVFQALNELVLFYISQLTSPSPLISHYYIEEQILQTEDDIDRCYETEEYHQLHQELTRKLVSLQYINILLWKNLDLVINKLSKFKEDTSIIQWNKIAWAAKAATNCNPLNAPRCLKLIEVYHHRLQKYSEFPRIQQYGLLNSLMQLFLGKGVLDPDNYLDLYGLLLHSLRYPDGSKVHYALIVASEMVMKDDFAWIETLQNIQLEVIKLFDKSHSKIKNYFLEHYLRSVMVCCMQKITLNNQIAFNLVSSILNLLAHPFKQIQAFPTKFFDHSVINRNQYDPCIHICNSLQSLFKELCIHLEKNRSASFSKQVDYCYLSHQLLNQLGTQLLPILQNNLLCSQNDTDKSACRSIMAFKNSYELFFSNYVRFIALVAEIHNRIRPGAQTKCKNQAIRHFSRRFSCHNDFDKAAFDAENHVAKSLHILYCFWQKNNDEWKTQLFFEIVPQVFSLYIMLSDFPGQISFSSKAESTLQLVSSIMEHNQKLSQLNEYHCKFWLKLVNRHPHMLNSEHSKTLIFTMINAIDSQVSANIQVGLCIAQRLVNLFTTNQQQEQIVSQSLWDYVITIIQSMLSLLLKTGSKYLKKLGSLLYSELLALRASTIRLVRTGQDQSNLAIVQQYLKKILPERFSAVGAQFHVSYIELLAKAKDETHFYNILKDYVVLYFRSQ